MEDDIYGSKKTYQKIKNNLEQYALPPKERIFNKRGRGKYHFKNKENLKYVENFFNFAESSGMSGSGVNRCFTILLVAGHVIEKNFKEATQEDLTRVVSVAFQTNKTKSSRETFIKRIKRIWNIICPELDSKGRPDMSKPAHATKHLKATQHKSQEKAREDKLTPEELKDIISYFDSDPQTQSFILCLYDAFLRPQEAAFLRNKDVKFYDEYITFQVSSHGKEGVGKTWTDKGIPYFIRWKEQHPYKNNEKSFFFVNQSSNSDKTKQFSLAMFSKRIKRCCKDLGIKKPITPYSFNRSGITEAVISATPHSVIQRKRRWSNLKQLKNYDLSNTEEVMIAELQRKGKIQNGKKKKEDLHKEKECLFCGNKNGFGDEFCKVCKRPLDRKKVQEQVIQSEMMLNNEIMKKFSDIEERLNKLKG
jgi:integrase